MPAFLMTMFADPIVQGVLLAILGAVVHRYLPILDPLLSRIEAMLKGLLPAAQPSAQTSTPDLVARLHQLEQALLARMLTPPSGVPGPPPVVAPPTPGPVVGP